MDVIGVLTAIAGSGLITGIIGYMQNLRINKASAEATAASAAATVKSSEADYTDRILKQADIRVAQMCDDRTRAFNERDEAYAEAKGQRLAKQEWRDKYYLAQAENHALELQIKDITARLQESEWHRCEIMACASRKPPRTENQP